MPKTLQSCYSVNAFLRFAAEQVLTNRVRDAVAESFRVKHMIFGVVHVIADELHSLGIDNT